MNLEAASQSLAAQYPSGDRPDLNRRERRIEKFGQFAFTGFLVVVALAVLAMVYMIFDRMVFSGSQPFVGLLLAAFVIFGLLTVAYVVFREDLKEKRQKNLAPTQPAELQMPPVTGRLLEEKEFEPVPAVTESTTELLPTRDRNR